MATITNSVVVSSEERPTYKRNRYRYTLSDGTVHDQNSWVPLATDNAADMATRGEALLAYLADQEIAGLLE